MTGFTPFMSRLLLANRLEREVQAIRDEERVRRALGYLHRGEPLRSVPLRKESNGRP